jgi:hypothetical protein
MDPTGSFLKTVIERVRGYLDDGDFDAKYTDQFLVNHVVMPALVDVWSRVSMNADNPVLLSYDITLVANQECYVIPPCIGEVHEIVQFTGINGTQTSDGVPTADLYPRHRMSVGGQNWALEGNMICFRPFPQGTGGNLTWTIRYTTNGDMMPHYCALTTSSGGTLTTSTTFTLPSTVGTGGLGQIDIRENAYAGQVLRLLNKSAGFTVREERVIESYNPATRVCTLRRPFTTNTAGESSYYAYEICPPQSQGMVEAVSLACSMKLGAWRKIAQSHVQMLNMQYRSAIKTIGDNLANMQMRTGKSWAKDTRDNPQWYP